MEEFNFSSLTPVQQVPSDGMGMTVTASPLILASHEAGYELTSPLHSVNNKENEDTTMYITVDTGPTSNILPMLAHSPPDMQGGSSSCYGTTTTGGTALLPNSVLHYSLPTDETMISPSHCNTAIASLIIGPDSTGREGFHSSFLANPSNDTSKQTPTILMDNIGPSIPTTTSSSVIPITSGIQPVMPEIETVSRYSNISNATETSYPCGYCPASMLSSSDYFEHWNTNHCQLLMPSIPSKPEPSSHHPPNNFIDTTKIASDELKNIIISSSIPPKSSALDDSKTNRSSESDNTGGLIMERCSVCNHIFVQGTERYIQHSQSGPCVNFSKQTNKAQSRNPIDTVNNNDSVPPGLQIMVPLDTEPKLVVADNVSKHVTTQVSNAQLSTLLPRQPVDIDINIANITGNKKRKLGLSPQEVSDKTLSKRQESPSLWSSSKNCVCGLCNEPVKTITSYFLHWLERHNDDDVNVKHPISKSNQINDCSSSTNILQEVWQCKACPSNVTKLFPDCGILNNHVELEHKSLAKQNNNVVRIFTSGCQINFRDTESLEKHQQMFHGARSKKENAHNFTYSICHLCNHTPSSVEMQVGATLCDHYRKEHLVKCKVCCIDVEVGSVEAAHYLIEHRGEMVWNRTDRLKLITNDTSVRSKILAGAQKPTRLSNGAIAKSISGTSIALKPSPVHSSINVNAKLLSNTSVNSIEKRHELPARNTPSLRTDQFYVVEQHQASPQVYEEIACSPVKRQKPGDNTVNEQNPLNTLGISNKSYSGKATIITTKILHSSQAFSNKSLMEKFVPISDGTTGGSGGSLNYRCKKCRMVFNSNEKVMEKHYFANHEFRCKFCEQIMDKDVYGVHLRQHLATERRKASISSTSPNENNNLNKVPEKR